ncbi:glycoside hydrolase family 3 protein [Streptacidiphilus monticola]
MNTPLPHASQPKRLPRRGRSAALAALTVVAAATAQGADVGTAAARTADHPAACPWMDTRLGADQRASLLLRASSLDQKLRWLVEIPANTPAGTTFAGGSASERGADGSVLSTTTTGASTYPAQLPCTPTVMYTDGPDYVRGAAGAAMFPAQIALAASWNAQLAYAKGQAQAADAFAAGRNIVLGPGVSGSRTPLAGRTPEYLGEDPLLSGELAAAGVNGLQSGGKVMAVLKHFVGNEQEYARQYSDDQVDTRTLNEVYNLPFEIALSRSSPGGVMCSYNQVNSRYACENPLLTSMLKGQDGFKGYVVSDFFAVHSTADSLNAGLDQELHSPIFYSPGNVKAALAKGQITMARIDDAAFRVVRSYIAAGLFDHPLPTAPAASAATAATRAVAEKIAEQGSVLLKNQGGVLPLSASAGSIAVIGQTASATPTDGVSAATVCAEGSSSGFGSPACPNVVAPSTRSPRGRPRTASASPTTTAPTSPRPSPRPGRRRWPWSSATPSRVRSGPHGPRSRRQR